MWVWVRVCESTFLEAKSIRRPGTGVTGSYAVPYLGAGMELRSSGWSLSSANY